MKFGLKQEDLDYIIDAISRFEEIEKAAMFGSRAMGNSKLGSDIDIAIYGDKVDMNTVAKLKYVLDDESPMPYFFDVVDYTHLHHKGLAEHIERNGIVFYKRKSK
mgnify:CR=1 FL=1